MSVFCTIKKRRSVQRTFRWAFQGGVGIVLRKNPSFSKNISEMAFQKNSLYQSIELLRRRPITIAIKVRCYLRSPPIISQMIKKIHNGHKMGHTIHKIIYTQIIGTISYLLILGYVITLLNSILKIFQIFYDAL